MTVGGAHYRRFHCIRIGWFLSCGVSHLFLCLSPVGFFRSVLLEFFVSRYWISSFLFLYHQLVVLEEEGRRRGRRRRGMGRKRGEEDEEEGEEQEELKGHI